MDETTPAPLDDNLVMAIDIVSAYVSNNRVPISELPSVIANVHAAVVGLGQERPAQPAASEKATPAAIRKSITPDALISFLDGKPYKTLRRHLSTNGLDDDAYRDRFGLPRDYPMTAATYSARRSEVAKSLGLGQKQRTPAARAEALVEAVPEKPRSVGRPRKVAKDAEA